jgi:hypothetical protein
MRIPFATLGHTSLVISDMRCLLVAGTESNSLRASHNGRESSHMALKDHNMRSERTERIGGEHETRSGGPRRDRPALVVQMTRFKHAGNLAPPDSLH